MTSSLVGSEMCIRDRSLTDSIGVQREQNVLPHVLFTTYASFLKQLFTPVSYTHLTLPTICSV
eukprot:1098114-Prorocentrum_lima.AAC.1